LTLAEKILAAHAGQESVQPGEFVNVRVDLVVSTNATGLLSVRQFHNLGAKKVFDPRKVVFAVDSFAAPQNIESAETAKELRAFAAQQGVLFYDVARWGFVHVLLPEKGLVLPGDVVIGNDPHACTYGAVGAFGTAMGATDIAYALAFGEIWMKVPASIKLVFHNLPSKWVGGKDLILHTLSRIGLEGANYQALEFTGEAVQALSMDDRFAMANMAIGTGAKAGLFPADERTLDYIEDRANRPYQVYQPDPWATYAQTIEFDVSSLEPQVAFPHSPANAWAVSEARGIEIDQAMIGSCSNGRMSDLRTAARVLTGRKIHSRVRCLVIPGSQEIFLAALQEGLIETFIRAGAAVSMPTSGPWGAGNMGILAAGEKCISTTHCNTAGCMGSPQAEIYLANPAVVAASSIAGQIVHPDEVMGI